MNLSLGPINIHLHIPPQASFHQIHAACAGNLTIQKNVYLTEFQLPVIFVISLCGYPGP